MQLKLSENIKFYRKKLELTQEELAENMSVTVGAVSKWESGANVPDISTLMELANFFDISMDELLGYNLSSKKVDDMHEKINDLCNAHNFKEAITEIKSALVRYPHSFKILYISAETYYLYVFEAGKKEYAQHAIDLYNKALEHISQSTEPFINEYSIKSKICQLYSFTDPKKALEGFKEINYEGQKSMAISLLLTKEGKREEALEHSTYAIIKSFLSSCEALSNTSYILASSGKRKDIEKALEMIDSMLMIIDAFTLKKLNYTHKLKATALSFKAFYYECLGDHESMKKNLKEAYRIAYEMDKENVSEELAKGLKYYFIDKPLFSFDNIGVGVVKGIENGFRKELIVPNSPLNDHLTPVLEYWKELKKGMKE